MMNEFSYAKIEECFKTLKLDITRAELATLVSDKSMTPESLNDIAFLFDYLSEKKKEATINMIMKTSRLPSKNPKTFDNFDFSLIKGKPNELEKLRSLPSLAMIHAHKNIAFIGPAGTGKTHLAQAFGHECCQQGLKTYFIKMSELRDRFTYARKNDKVSSVMNGLVRPSCLIIDEVGHCVFDKENTRLFFDLMDRRYNKEGSFNVVFTSNKVPSLWKDNFEEDDALLCALDRIFDDAVVYTIKGQSYRGKKLENVILQTSAIKHSESSEEPTIK